MLEKTNPGELRDPTMYMTNLETQYNNKTDQNIEYNSEPA